jgi:hypothetical protein
LSFSLIQIFLSLAGLLKRAFLRIRTRIRIFLKKKSKNFQKKNFFFKNSKNQTSMDKPKIWKICENFFLQKMLKRILDIQVENSENNIFHEKEIQ